MTAPAPSPYEQAEIDRFGIFDEERVVEVVARAIAAESHGLESMDEDGWEYYLRADEQDDYRRLAAAAVAAYRAQDGGAEEAVRRVEALADIYEDASEYAPQTATYTVAKALRAALAPQAGDER